MDIQDIIQQLKDVSSKKYKENVVKMGIPEENCLGVSSQDIRKIAKNIPCNQSLAFDLWHSQYHDAKLLAVLIFEKKKITLDEIASLIDDVESWDLCNFFCKGLIIKVKDYQTLIPRFILSHRIYTKRAAFVLMASDIIYNKNIPNDTLDMYLNLIYEHSHESHVHVKKAVSTALKEIGKKNFLYHEKSLEFAYNLYEEGDRVQRWIAHDVIKELENLVEAKGRTRLISRHSQMGRNEKEQ